MEPSALWKLIGETVTQILAFGIFFWILKAMAWKPLMQLLDDRQQAIDDGFEDIKQKQEEAEKLRVEYAEHLKKIEAEAREKIQEAVNEGRRTAEELIVKAQEESARLKEQAQRNIAVELGKARVELRNDVVAMTLSATEKMLREKMDGEVNQRLVATFVDELNNRKN